MTLGIVVWAMVGLWLVLFLDDAIRTRQAWAARRRLRRAMRGGRSDA